MQASPLYEVTLNSPRDLFCNTYILAGLHELRHRGIVNLKYRFTDFEKYWPDPAIADPYYREKWGPDDFINTLELYTVKHLSSGRTSRVGFDMSDDPDMFVPALLKKCDLLFKRNYQSKYTDYLDPESRRKIRPFGLLYGVRSTHEQHESLLYLGKAAYDLSKLHYRGMTSRKGLRQHLINPLGKLRYEFRRHRDTKTIPDYEQDCHDPTKPYLLFQTRTWIPRGTRKIDFDRINEQRASLIRKLRAAFGERFVGGLIPDDYAREHFPDCLTASATDLRGYTNLIKQAAIVVYTQGLVDSPAWKLAEYLAAGKCIVAEPLATELPKPLVNDQDLVFYQSEDDCVNQCARLLDDPASIERLACNARAYYQAEVEPSAHILQILQSAVR
ncbi:MAG: glycosyltransferase [Chloroflexota bacterium]